VTCYSLKLVLDEGVAEILRWCRKEEERRCARHFRIGHYFGGKIGEPRFYYGSTSSIAGEVCRENFCSARFYLSLLCGGRRGYLDDTFVEELATRSFSPAEGGSRPVVYWSFEKGPGLRFRQDEKEKRGKKGSICIERSWRRQKGCKREEKGKGGKRLSMLFFFKEEGEVSQHQRIAYETR